MHLGFQDGRRKEHPRATRPSLAGAFGDFTKVIGPGPALPPAPPPPSPPPPSPPPPPPGCLSRVLSLVGHAGKYCADDSDGVNCNRDGLGGWEKFTPVDIGGGQIALKGGRAGLYCADDPDRMRCNRHGIGGWEKFTVVSIGDGKVALKGGRNGQWCADEGTRIICDRNGIGHWERFTQVCS